MARLVELRTALRAHVEEAMHTDPAHDIAHLDRVWANVQQIADGEGADMDVLLAAAYLHDLINLPKTHLDRAKASQLSAKAALPIVDALGFDASAQKSVYHVIEAHSYSAGITPETLEAAILRDADRLDALGAIGIARTFVVAGQSGTVLYDPMDPFATHRALDDRRFALDHWQIKLLRLPGGMLTPKGQELAKERANIMRQFLEDLARETGVPLPQDLLPR